MSFRIIWKKFATIATLGTNQDSTLSQRLNSLVEKESDVPEQVGLAFECLIYLLGQYLAFAKYSWCFPGELFVCTQLPSYHTGCQQNLLHFAGGQCAKNVCCIVAQASAMST